MPLPACHKGAVKVDGNVPSIGISHAFCCKETGQHPTQTNGGPHAQHDFRRGNCQKVRNIQQGIHSEKGGVGVACWLVGGCLLLLCARLASLSVVVLSLAALLAVCALLGVELVGQVGLLSRVKSSVGPRLASDVVKLKPPRNGTCPRRWGKS